MSENRRLQDSVTPRVTRRGQPHTSKTLTRVERRETYPEGTFETLLVIATDRCKDIQELEDALLIIEISYLLECLLNQFTECLSLQKRREKLNKGFIIFYTLDNQTLCVLCCLYQTMIARNSRDTLTQINILTKLINTITLHSIK